MSGIRHGLSEVFDFGRAGRRAVCTCGWKSSTCDTLRDATSEFDKHASSNQEQL